MNLLEDFENRLVNIVRVTNTSNDYGGVTQTRNTVSSDVRCKIDYNSGNSSRLVQGKQAQSRNTLFCAATVDIRIGDKITNIRDLETGAVEKVDVNGTLVASEYEVKWVSNPGSEDDHLEVDIERLDGQTLV